MKFVTFIDAMLSLVVTQDVLPEAEGAQHAAQSSGLLGIGLGALTMIIGLWMLLRRRWAAVDSGARFRAIAAHWPAMADCRRGRGPVFRCVRTYIYEGDSMEPA